MNTRRLPRLLSTLVVVLATVVTATAAVAAAPSALPDAFEGRYIVVFGAPVDAPSTASAVAQAHGLRVGFVYEHALQGMSASVPAGRLAALQRDPRVAYVVEDMVRTISAQEIPTGIRRIFADENGDIGIDGVDDYRVDVDVAVIDTGIDLEHPDLNVFNSVSCLYSSGGGPPWARSYYCDAGGDDDHYHGTHVAGTIAALDNGLGVVGVAPGARLWAVKVCDAQGSCPSSAIIAGIDHVAGHAGSIEVANMSLGGAGYNQAEYDAIQGVVDAGVAFAVAAGNDDDDANNYSPAAFDNALTVSALADFDGEPGGHGEPTCRTDQDDTLADFSNWGNAVQIAAPGVCILSTFPIEQGEYGTISGTSMASPHAAGALALLASSNNPGNATDVYNLYDQVINAGNFDWTDDSGDGIQEPLLDVSTFSPKLIPSGGGNVPPSADFTYTTSDLTAYFTDQSTDSDGSIVSWAWDFGDGSTSTEQNPSHTYAADGTYPVTLTVTDDDGATDTASQDVTVSSGEENQLPVASFTYTCTDLACDFTDQSSDPDGSIVSWAWAFGDGSTATAQNPSHTYAADGTYTVALTVTDDDGATDTASQDVTVSSGGGEAGGMYVWDMSWKETGPHLKATVTILVDSDGDGVAESTDDPVSGATVSFTLSNDSDGSQSYTGTTDAAGVVEFQWKRAPSGMYTGEVTGLTHTTYTWDSSLDADNPDTYTK
ncbi:MAG: S8 family serine peptidase [Chloroflexota bacterium]|nr:S8 family serine peptidase [Chloroflexota bacterium]